MPSFPKPFIWRGRMHICSRPTKENSRTARNIFLKFLPCQKNFLKNILTHSSLKSEVSVVWKNFIFWVVFYGDPWVSNLVYFLKSFYFYLFIDLTFRSVLYSIRYFWFGFSYIIISIFLWKGLLKSKCFWLEKKHHDPSQPFRKLMAVVIEFWNFLIFYQTFIFFETERDSTLNNSWS